MRFRMYLIALQFIKERRDLKLVINECSEERLIAKINSIENEELGTMVVTRVLKKKKHD